MHLRSLKYDSKNNKMHMQFSTLKDKTKAKTKSWEVTTELETLCEKVTCEWYGWDGLSNINTVRFNCLETQLFHQIETACLCIYSAQIIKLEFGVLVSVKVLGDLRQKCMDGS